MRKVKDRSKEVFIEAMSGEKLTNSRQTQGIAAKLATGNYPAGLSDCFIMGTMGQCGMDCFVLQQGDCEFVCESFDNHHATMEQVHQLFDDGYYQEEIREYCRYKGWRSPPPPPKED